MNISEISTDKFISSRFGQDIGNTWGWLGDSLGDARVGSAAAADGNGWGLLAINCKISIGSVPFAFTASPRHGEYSLPDQRNVANVLLRLGGCDGLDLLL